MEINQAYNFSLLSPFNGYSNFANTMIRGKVGISTALAIDPGFVDIYNRTKYTLPNALKGLVLEQEEFYIVSPSNDNTQFVIPVAFVVPTTITKASLLVQTYTFKLNGPDELNFLRSLFTDNNIDFE